MYSYSPTHTQNINLFIYFKESGVSEVAQFAAKPDNVS